MNVFEKILSIIENEYAPFLNKIIKCTNQFDEFETNNQIFNIKIIKQHEQKKIELNKIEYKNKTSFNLAQYFYYLTIQLKYYNHYFLKNEITEENIEKLIIFLKLDSNKRTLLENEEKQWFNYIENLRNFNYEASFIIETNKKILNFAFNTFFSCTFTSNPISITKINKNMVIFLLPISFTKSIIIFFFKKNVTVKKRNELINLEQIRFNLLINLSSKFEADKIWKYTNYNFWNYEKNVLIPNRKISNTRLIYYPFDVFSYRFGGWDKVIDKDNWEEEMYKLWFSNGISDAIISPKQKNDINKIRELHSGPIFLFCSMILKYDKKIEYEDKNFQKEFNELINRLTAKWTTPFRT